MKQLLTITIAPFLLATVHAQDSCLPVYNMPVKTMQLSSGKLAYVEKGNGQTILFVHGLGGNISHWEKIVRDLSASYRCIAIDLPGYGWSDKQVDANGDDRLQLYAGVINEFIQKKKIRKVILAGHSMGAQVAIITALQNKRIKKLILVAPAGLETFTNQEAQLLTGVTTAIALEQQNEAVIRNNFKINFVQQPADVEQLIQDRLRMKKCSIYKRYCQIVSAGVKGMLVHPVKDSLQYLSMPVLIVFGAKDALIPNAYLHPALITTALATESAALIPGCKLEIIQEAGHMVQFEKSNEINVIIKKFIQ